MLAKQADERTGILKSTGHTNIIDRKMAVVEQLAGPFHPVLYQVLMRCDMKKPQEFPFEMMEG